MKILIVLFTLYFCLTGSIYSQDGRSDVNPFTVAVDGGMTMSKISFDVFTFPGELYGDMRISFLTGAELEYAISPKVRIRSGVNYVQLGGKNEEMVQTDTEGREIGMIRALNKWSYVEVPLLLRYVVKRERYSRYVSSGVTVGFLTAATLDFDSDIDGGVSIKDEDISDALKSTVFGLNLSAGVQIPLRAAIGLDVEATYNFGLTNHLDNSDGDLSQKLRSWRFVLGLYRTL